MNSKIKWLRNKLNGLNMQGMIVTNPVNIKYLTNIEAEGILLITADHGNSEQMIDYKTGEPHTAHTTNPVPLILVGKDDVKLKSGKLADLAPTMLDLMNLSKPEEMTGESLLVK